MIDFNQIMTSDYTVGVIAVILVILLILLARKKD